MTGVKKGFNEKNETEVRIASDWYVTHVEVDNDISENNKKKIVAKEFVDLDTLGFISALIAFIGACILYA